VPSRSPRLPAIVAALRKLYGPPEAAEPQGAFSLILWENVAYLADDAKRAAAFDRLRRRVGTTPAKILGASRAELRAIARAGILADGRVEKIRESGRIAMEEFGGDLDSALDGPLPQAKKALKRFPGIGDPGAEKILLLCRKEKVLALDSNGLRVLQRLGYGRKEKSYAAAYRSVQQAIRAEGKDGFDWLIAAHRLLRRHGQELCRNTRPRCEACPLRKNCAYFRSFAAGG
jgi:endonuclease-3